VPVAAAGYEVRELFELALYRSGNIDLRQGVDQLLRSSRFGVSVGGLPMPTWLERHPALT
jgi:hypothetical protein